MAQNDSIKMYRIYEMVSIFSRIEFWDFVENYLITASSPMARLLYWVVGKTGIYGLLPVISTFVTYSLIFYTIEKTQERFFIARKNVAYTLWFLMATSIYMSTIGGIRMMMAISMITFCFFRESIEKKFSAINILLYIIAIFMHNMALIVITVRFLVWLFSDSRKRGKIRVLLLMGVLGAIFILNFSTIIKDIFENASYYLKSDDYLDRWEYMIGIIILIIVFGIIHVYKILMLKEKGHKINSYTAMMKACSLLAIAFIFQFSIFYRFAGHIVPILSIPVMMITMEKEGNKQLPFFRQIDFRSALLMCSILIMAISLFRGSMSSLKFFEL